METIDLRKRWLISLWPVYIKAFQDGTKLYEIRTRVPSELRHGDIIYAAETGSMGVVRISFEVEEILFMKPSDAWGRFCRALGIDKRSFEAYTAGRNEIVLIRVKNVKKNPSLMTVKDLGLRKAPMWFAKCRN